MNKYTKYLSNPNAKLIKTCPDCGLEKSYLEFHIKHDKNKYFYLTGHCKPCAHARATNRNFINRYGITEEEVYKLLDQQNGKCVICKMTLTPPSSGTKKLKSTFNVDHCHKTNKVRGLLCLGCNTGLGQFRDNKELLTSATRYLEMFGDPDE